MLEKKAMSVYYRLQALPGFAPTRISHRRLQYESDPSSAPPSPLFAVPVTVAIAVGIVSASGVAFLCRNAF